MSWTYASLKTKIADFLNRADLTAVIPDFITLAEDQMNRKLDCRQMTTLVTFNLTGETYPVPCDFAGVKSFRVNSDPVRKLEYRNAEEFDDILDDAYAATGKPRYYTISNDKFYFSPTPDGSYGTRLRYRQRIPSLAEFGTNWILDRHKDAYLYGALTQSAPYLKDDARLSVWGGLFEAAIADINADDARQNTAARPSARVKRIG